MTPMAGPDLSIASARLVLLLPLPQVLERHRQLIGDPDAGKQDTSRSEHLFLQSVGVVPCCANAEMVALGCSSTIVVAPSAVVDHAGSYINKAPLDYEHLIPG